MKVSHLEETSTSVQLSAVCLSVAVPLLLPAAGAQPLPHLVLVLQPQRVGGPAQRRRLGGSEPGAESSAGGPGVAAALPAPGPPAQTTYAFLGNISPAPAERGGAAVHYFPQTLKYFYVGKINAPPLYEG